MCNFFLVSNHLTLYSHAVFSAFGRPQGNAPSLKDLGQAENKIQSLRVWDPPEFCLAFFW